MTGTPGCRWWDRKFENIEINLIPTWGRLCIITTDWKWYELPSEVLFCPSVMACLSGQWCGDTTDYRRMIKFPLSAQDPEVPRILHWTFLRNFIELHFFSIQSVILLIRYSLHLCCWGYSIKNFNSCYPLIILYAYFLFANYKHSQRIWKFSLCSSDSIRWNFYTLYQTVFEVRFLFKIEGRS